MGFRRLLFLFPALSGNPRTAADDCCTEKCGEEGDQPSPAALGRLFIGCGIRFGRRGIGICGSRCVLRNRILRQNVSTLVAAAVLVGVAVIVFAAVLEDGHKLHVLRQLVAFLDRFAGRFIYPSVKEISFFCRRECRQCGYGLIRTLREQLLYGGGRRIGCTCIGCTCIGCGRRGRILTIRIR